MLQIESDVALTVSLTVYPRPALFRACYYLSDRCWIWLVPQEPNGVLVHLLRKQVTDDLAQVQRAFAEVLIDHAVRWQIDCETREFRQTLVRIAMGEADRG